MAKLAIRRTTGARGLRTILEQAMLDIMYEMPSQKNILALQISEEAIKPGCDVGFETERPLDYHPCVTSVSR